VFSEKSHEKCCPFVREISRSGGEGAAAGMGRVEYKKKKKTHGN